MCVCYVGIGQGRITKNVEGAPIDYALLVKDTDAVAMVSNGFLKTCHSGTVHHTEGVQVVLCRHV